MKKHADEVPKHRSDHYFVYSDKYPILVIKTFALDIDTVACNEFYIVPSTWFLIYPRFTARSTHFASLRASSRINHSTKFVQEEPISVEYVTHSLVIYTDRPSIGENIACESQGANLLKGVQGRRMNRTPNDHHRRYTGGNSIAIHWNRGRPPELIDPWESVSKSYTYDEARCVAFDWSRANLVWKFFKPDLFFRTWGYPILRPTNVTATRMRSTSTDACAWNNIEWMLKWITVAPMSTVVSAVQTTRASSQWSSKPWENSKTKV